MRRKALTRAKQIKRTVKLVTNQSILPYVLPPSPLHTASPQLTSRPNRNETPEGEEIPMRGWDISIYLVGPDGEELPANCFEKVVYVLHESFGKRAKQTIKTPPFMIKEKGWGEFDMLITLTPIGAPKGGDQTLQHDLNFAQERYESTHSVVCLSISGFISCLVGTDEPRSSAIPSPNSSKSSKSPDQLATRTAQQPQARAKRPNANPRVETWTWTNWPRRCRSCQKTTCCKSCKWCTTTRRRRRTPRTIWRVSFPIRPSLHLSSPDG